MKPLPCYSPGLSVCRSSIFSCSLSIIAFVTRLWSATTGSKAATERCCERIRKTSVRHLDTAMRGNTRKTADHPSHSASGCFGMYQVIRPRIFPHLLRWQIFNVLAGNSDGHAKNLSLLYTATGEIRLAPFYDLVCTRAIERIDHHLALSVGNERNPGVVVKRHWEDMARQCDIRPQYLLDLVHEVATRCLLRV